MTQMESHKLNCPKCGHLQDTVVWSSLNVSLDPNLREKLFSGEINVFVCQECGNRAMINTSLLYHDMHREYCVQYCPGQAIEDPEFLKSFTKDGKLKIDRFSKVMGEIGHYFMKPHIVFDLNVGVKDGIRVGQFMLPDRKEWLSLGRANFSTDDPIFSRPEIREVVFPADAGADRKLSSL